MNPGDQVKIKATVLRVEGNRLDAQTADGRLIQTDISNVMRDDEAFIGKDFADAAKREKTTATERRPAEKKSDTRHEHKAELRAPENKSAKK